MSGNLSQPASFRDEDLQCTMWMLSLVNRGVKQHFAQSLSARSNMFPVLDDHQPVRWQVQLSIALTFEAVLARARPNPTSVPISMPLSAVV